MSEEQNSSDIEEQGSSSTEVEFDELFDMFCKVGDRSSEDMNLRNLDKWFKQANLFTDGLTTTDTAIMFSKIAKSKKKITKDEFHEMLSQLGDEIQMSGEDLQARLTAAGKPSFSGITRPIRGSAAAINMERLSDPTTFTGTHKERFDSEGRGLGLAGRYDVAKVDGYVQGYKNQGTYGSTEEMQSVDDDQNVPTKPAPAPEIPKKEGPF